MRASSAAGSSEARGGGGVASPMLRPVLRARVASLLSDPSGSQLCVVYAEAGRCVLHDLCEPERPVRVLLDAGAEAVAFVLDAGATLSAEPTVSLPVTAPSDWLCAVLGGQPSTCSDGSASPGGQLSIHDRSGVRASSTQLPGAVGTGPLWMVACRSLLCVAGPDGTALVYGVESGGLPQLLALARGRPHYPRCSLAVCPSHLLCGMAGAVELCWLGDGDSGDSGGGGGGGGDSAEEGFARETGPLWMVAASQRTVRIRIHLTSGRDEPTTPDPSDSGATSGAEVRRLRTRTCPLVACPPQEAVSHLSLVQHGATGATVLCGTATQQLLLLHVSAAAPAQPLLQLCLATPVPLALYCVSPAAWSVAPKEIPEVAISEARPSAERGAEGGACPALLALSEGQALLRFSLRRATARLASARLAADDSLEAEAQGGALEDARGPPPYPLAPAARLEPELSLPLPDAPHAVAALPALQASAPSCALLAVAGGLHLLALPTSDQVAYRPPPPATLLPSASPASHLMPQAPQGEGPPPEPPTERAVATGSRPQGSRARGKK